MKRFFSRKDSKSTTGSQKPSPVAVTVTPPAAAAESDQRRGSESKDFLTPNIPSASADTARKRPTFFDFSSPLPGSTTQLLPKSPSPSLSHSHSDVSSAPLTGGGGSISGSSDASSSVLSTPSEDRTTVQPARTVSDTKTWPSWMSNITKSTISKSTRSKLHAVSTFTNVSRSTTTTGSSAALSRPSTSTASNTTTSDSDSSDDSDSSSWDGKDDLHKKRRTKIRGRKTIRAPGGRQVPPIHHHQQQSVKAQVRSIFGGHSVAAPLSRETSKALANLQALTIDALVPPTSAPPLVSSTSSIPFPRSSNKLHLHHLHAVSSSSALHSPLHVEILRKRLLRRIERRQLTSQEQESIRVLATNRSARPRNADKRKLPSAEETYEDSKAVGGGWSKGMKRWAMRPCFEERVVVYRVVHDGNVVIAPVERDSRAAVAALEFSEGAEALAGLHRQNELPPPPSDIYVPASNRKLPPPLVIPRSQHGVGATKPSNLLASSTNRSRLGPSRLRSPLDISELQQSNQDEDDLPLGVVMLQRRQKDEAEERKRRALQEKVERERREEEKRKKYQEEVLAARSRRDVEKGGILVAKKQDAWLNGDADALPPPPKPAYASHHIKSSSNPNLATSASSVTGGGLQVPKPANRRMTSESSVVSSVTATATATATVTATASASKPVDAAKPQQQQQQPLTPMSAPSPWSGLPSRSGSFNASTMPTTHHPGLPHSNSFPRMPSSMPLSAPATQTGMNYGNASMSMMMPPIPDPMTLAMFEQGMLRPWTMVDPFGGHGSQNGSNEVLTPPRLPFSVGFGSSGDSSGSLTPPRFPNSRPPSWGSSTEDVRLTMQRTGGGSLGARPISVASGSGESQDWRKSRSSMLVPTAGDESRNRNSHSKSPQDRQQSLPVPNKAGHQRINTSTSVGRSEKSEVPSSFSKHSFLTRANSARPEDTIGSGNKTPTHRSSANNLRSNSTHNLHTTSSSINLRSGSGSGSQSRSWTVPAPKPVNPPPKNPYGLPSSQSYGPSSGSSALRESFKPGLPSSQSTDAVAVGGGGRQRPPLHAHSKSSGAPTKKSRLFG